MLSVRYFKSDHPEKPLNNKLRVFQSPKKTERTLWQECLQKLLTPSVAISKQYQKCRDVFDLYIQSRSSRDELTIIISYMQEALLDCMKISDCTTAEREFINAALFATHYSFIELSKCPWNDGSPQSNAAFVYIVGALNQLVVESGWIFIDNLQAGKFESKGTKSNEDLINEIVFHIVFAESSIADMSLRYIDYLRLSLCDLTGQKKDIVMSGMKELCLDMEKRVHKFHSDLAKRKITITNDRMNNQFEQMLFHSISTRAELAIMKESIDEAEDYFMLCDNLKIKLVRGSKMKIDYMYLKKSLEELKSRMIDTQPLDEISTQTKTNIIGGAKERQRRAHHVLSDVPDNNGHVARVPLPTLRTDPIHVPDIPNMPKLTHAERERIRKSLKKTEKREKLAEIRRLQINELVIETDLKPACYENPELESLILDISAIFNRSSCEGYLFGSANYKTDPNDLDIVLPDIKASEGHLEALINLFEDNGWKESTSGKRKPGMRGYINSSNIHVIPMEKEINNQIRKIEFTVFGGSYPEHAENLDITLGAMYYDLRQNKMFCMKSHTSYCEEEQKIVHTDFKYKTINTILDSTLSFTNDPVRIFREIRLHVTKKYTMSPACEAGIKQAFSNEGNLFKKMNSKNLDDQLSLICTSGYEVENITKIQELGLLNELYRALAERTDPAAARFIERFKNTCPVLTLDWDIKPHNAKSSLQQCSHFKPGPVKIASYIPCGLNVSISSSEKSLIKSSSISLNTP